MSGPALRPCRSRGDLFAIAGNDGVVRVVTLPADLRELSRAELVQIRGHGDVITKLAISPDGRYLASTSVDGRLWITDISRAKWIARWPLHDLRFLRYFLGLHDAKANLGGRLGNLYHDFIVPLFGHTRQVHALPSLRRRL